MELDSLNFNEKSCRACMESVDPLLSVSFIKNTDLIDKYVNCTSIEVDFTDGVALNLCEKCHKLINDFYDFRKMCVENYEKMVNYIRTRNPANGENVDIKEDIEEYKVEVEVAEESDADYEDKEDLDSIHEDQNSEYSCKSDEDSSDTDIKSNAIKNKRSKKSNKKVKGKNTNASKLKPSLKCNTCGKKFLQKLRYEGHLREHEGLKPCVCTTCQKEFTNWNTFYGHMKTAHTRGLSFSCTLNGCDKMYRSKQGLDLHIKKIHEGIKAALYICELCGKGLTTKNALQKHKNVHAGIRPFACDKCPKRYATKCKLKEHILRHMGIKNFTCAQCGLKKTTRHELNIHMRTHTKEKMYKCDFCSNLFSNIGNLSRHISLVHMKIKNYRCTYCDLTFGKSETLKHHVMRHTGEKPHGCTICGKRFIQQVALQTHMKTHNKIKK